MYGYIYETTNLVNGKKYIGKHKSERFDKTYLGSGIALKKAIKKYGEKNFKTIILEKINTNQKDLDLREMFYIKKFNAVKDKKYYNRSYGGENEGWFGVNQAVKEQGGLTEETRRKMSHSRRGNKHPMYGKHHSEQTKEKMRQIKKGKKTLEETKKKQSEALKGEKSYWYGKNLTEETKEKLSIAQKKRNLSKDRNPFYGKHHTKEAKKKVSKAHKGKNLSKEHRIKISKALKGHIGFNKGIPAHNKSKICINNGFINKYISREYLIYYLDNGWILGGKPRKNT